MKKLFIRVKIEESTFIGIPFWFSKIIIRLFLVLVFMVALIGIIFVPEISEISIPISCLVIGLLFWVASFFRGMTYLVKENKLSRVHGKDFFYSYELSFLGIAFLFWVLSIITIFY